MFNNITNMERFINPLFKIPTNTTDETLMKRAYYKSIYYGVLSNILLGMFEYENMDPQTRESLERTFFFHSFAGANDTEDYGTVIAPVMPAGNVNIFGEHDSYSMYFPDGSIKTFDNPYDNPEFVLGRNTTMPMVCDAAIVEMYADQLTEIKLSIINSTILSRVSGLIVGNENDIKNNKTVFDNHRLGVPVMLSTKYEQDKLQTYSFAKPTTVNEYYDNFRDCINEFLMVTGLSSLVNPNKKERLLVDEISSTDDIKNTLLRNKVNNRIEFIENINEKFGYDYTVKLNPNIYQDVIDLQNLPYTEMSGGIENVSE